MFSTRFRGETPFLPFDLFAAMYDCTVQTQAKILLNSDKSEIEVCRIAQTHSRASPIHFSTPKHANFRAKCSRKSEMLYHEVMQPRTKAKLFLGSAAKARLNRKTKKRP